MKERNDSYQTVIKQLVVQVRKGNQGAFAELLKLFEPLFASLLATADTGDFNRQDIEDLRQELTLVFFHSILSYDLEQNEVQFGLYSKICMRNALITQLRKLQKRKTPLPFDEDEEDTMSRFLGTAESPSVELTSRETVETMNKKIEETLSPFETEVWQRYLAGNTAKKIASVLEKNEKSIENAICRIKRKLRSLFKAEF